ncbi:hypothetical protein, partial [Gordonia jinhuaensis]
PKKLTENHHQPHTDRNPQEPAAISTQTGESKPQPKKQKTDIKSKNAATTTNQANHGRTKSQRQQKNVASTKQPNTLSSSQRTHTPTPPTSTRQPQHKSCIITVTPSPEQLFQRTHLAAWPQIRCADSNGEVVAR